MEASLQDTELAALKGEIEELIASNEQVMRENEVLESFLYRNVADPTELVDADEGDTRTKGRFKKSGKKSKSKPVTLTWEQKLDIVRSELETVKKDAVETEKNSNRMIDTLKAVLEQTDVRIADLKKEAYEFKRDIVVGAENFRTGHIMAEKLVRYFETVLSQKDSVIEKLRLKNNSLKTQFKKMQTQLQQKQETGDVLHYIDFHQLQIENKQYAAKIEERTEERRLLKIRTTNTVQQLNSLKTQLGALMKEVADLKSEIKQRSELLDKLKASNTTVGAEMSRTRRAGDRLKGQVDDHAGMPEVLDYLSQKATEFDLSRDVENWTRKVEIAEMAASRSK